MPLRRLLLPLLLSLGCSSSEPTQLSIPTSKGATAREEPWVDASKAAARIGDVSVRIDRVSVEQQAMDEEGKNRFPWEPTLHVWLTITNHSVTKKLDYRGWGDGPRFGEPEVIVRDTLGNSYIVQSFIRRGIAPGSLQGVSLYPGKEARDLLFFQRPVDPAKDLTLELPAGDVDEKGRFRFRIPDSMIRRR